MIDVDIWAILQENRYIQQKVKASVRGKMVERGKEADSWTLMRIWQSFDEPALK